MGGEIWILGKDYVRAIFPFEANGVVSHLVWLHQNCKFSVKSWEKERDGDWVWWVWGRDKEEDNPRANIKWVDRLIWSSAVQELWWFRAPKTFPSLSLSPSITTSCRPPSWLFLDLIVPLLLSLSFHYSLSLSLPSLVLTFFLLLSCQ